MIFGMSLPVFTAVHVAISLLGLLTGIVVVAQMLRRREAPRWTLAFLVTTVLTSATGFLFPVDTLLPSHIVGIISLAVLLAENVAYYVFKGEGHWRWVYVVSALTAFYLNAFVAVVQAFLKVPVLNTLAPTGSEPPFAIAHSALLIAFIGVGYLAVGCFRRPLGNI